MSETLPPRGSGVLTKNIIIKSCIKITKDSTTSYRYGEKPETCMIPKKTVRLDAFEGCNVLLILGHHR